MKRGLSILMCMLLFLGVCAGCAGEKKELSLIHI